MQIHYFSHARSGFKLFLQSINKATKNKILLPDFICDTLVEAIKEANFEFQFYPIKDDLEPNWKDIETMDLTNVYGIIMVHYFGQPQNINKFTNFCKLNKILLIEDIAHSYESYYMGKKLGTFGDIGISSPRKILNIISGGILYINKKKFFFKYKKLLNFKSSNISIIYCILKKKYIKTHFFFHKIFKNNFKFADPYKDKSIKINDYLIDKYSMQKILDLNKSEIEKIKTIRLKQYNKWYLFCKKNNLKPVIKSYNNDSIPWCFPAYTSNISESESWYLWGKKNNLDIFSWPVLPEEVINNNDYALNRWRKLICFPINNNED